MKSDIVVDWKIWYHVQMRIVKCEKCGTELQVRSSFAYMTLNNHKKVCEKS